MRFGHEPVQDKLGDIKPFIAKVRNVDGAKMIVLLMRNLAMIYIHRTTNDFYNKKSSEYDNGILCLIKEQNLKIKK